MIRLSTGARFATLAVLAALVAAIAGAPAAAQPAAPSLAPSRPSPGERPAQELPAALTGVGFDQRLGEALPLDLTFIAEDEREVSLGGYFGAKPVILTFVYYECPMLCTLVLNGLTSALKAVPFTAGEDYAIVTVSIDPGETPALARAKKASYVRELPRPEIAAQGWHFLTGDTTAIATLTRAAGFRYRYDAERDDFAHASGILVLTPEGTISRVLYGIEYAPKDLRLALVEASAGKIGTFVDQVLLFCFHYDPAAGKYGTAIMRLIRTGGLLAVLVIAIFVLASLRRERRAQRERQAQQA
jgi:protein SCO1